MLFSTKRGNNILAKPKVVFNKTSLSEDVYKTLKDKIRMGQLNPGQRILLREFADEIGNCWAEGHRKIAGYTWNLSS